MTHLDALLVATRDLPGKDLPHEGSEHQHPEPHLPVRVVRSATTLYTQYNNNDNYLERTGEKTSFQNIKQGSDGR